MDFAPVSMPPRRVKEKELTDNQRMQVVAMLLGMSALGPLPYGAITKVAKKFQISRETVSRLWGQAKTSRAQGIPNENEIVSKKNRRGDKDKWDADAGMDAMKSISVKKRKTIRHLAERLEMPTSTVQYLKAKKKVIVRHSNALKPTLTDEHLVARVDYALSQRDPNNLTKYQDMYDRIDLDEKWFYMTEDNEVYLLAADEEPPQRSTKHKGYIQKVMFLSAVARPRKINGQWWDGKIGIWPVGHFEPAQQSSVNRERGTLVWKNDTIDKAKYQEMLIDCVLPAVLAKFPTVYLDRYGIRLQQDGAKSHIDPNDPEWLEAVAATGCKISLYTQPAQSPDTNLNDLAFFRSIQSLYYRAAVLAAYNEYPIMQMNRMWLTLMSCCNMILEHNGSNHYKIPHMNKKRMEREGTLPKVLSVSIAAARFDSSHPL